ncbi:MAG: ABC transporter ATP-binding protein [Rhodothermales bacterium]|nr:ABC transporter ATP-binding protein [Rhodothermales bacterium]
MTLEITDLIKRYGDKTAIDIPRLKIVRGETFGLVGSNGAGKTTFLRLVLDLLLPDLGSAVLGGINVRSSTAWKEYTGAYLDESFILDFLTPGEYLKFIGRTQGLSDREIEELVAPFQPFVPAESLQASTKFLRELSKGYAKKIGLIGALAFNPGLVILDEPFANLDPGSQIRLKSMIRRLNEEKGTTIIISSHDLLHVTDICKRIAILENGKIIRDMPTSEATLRDLQRYFTTSELSEFVATQLRNEGD